MRTLVFKGGKPILRRGPDRQNPCWIDCDTISQTTLSLLKEKEIDTKDLLVNIHKEIIYPTKNATLVSIRFINENGALDKVWLLLFDGCVITKVRRSNEWNKIFDRLKLEAETKNLDERQIFTYILAETIEQNGSKIENIWRDRDIVKAQKAMVLLNEEEEILKIILKKKQVALREEQYDLLKESLETVRQQRSLFKS